jgi:hypothetical protein
MKRGAENSSAPDSVEYYRLISLRKTVANCCFYPVYIVVPESAKNYFLHLPVHLVCGCHLNLLKGCVQPDVRSESGQIFL